MQILYTLTKAEWDDYHEANTILTKVKAILETSNIYNHELSIPAMTMYLVAERDELAKKLKETETLNPQAIPDKMQYLKK